MSNKPDLDTLTIEDVARLLRVTRDTLYRTWKDKVERAGFPAPLPTQGKRKLWDPVAIRAWMDQDMPDHLRQDSAAPDDAARQEERAARAMDERAEQLAALY